MKNTSRQLSNKMTEPAACVFNLSTHHEQAGPNLKSITMKTQCNNAFVYCKRIRIAECSRYLPN